jgi:hypothetical protein
MRQALNMKEIKRNNRCDEYRQTQQSENDHYMVSGDNTVGVQHAKGASEVDELNRNRVVWITVKMK